MPMLMYSGRIVKSRQKERERQKGKTEFRTDNNNNGDDDVLFHAGTETIFVNMIL